MRASLAGVWSSPSQRTSALSKATLANARGEYSRSGGSMTGERRYFLHISAEAYLGSTLPSVDS